VNINYIYVAFRVTKMEVAEAWLEPYTHHHTQLDFGSTVQMYVALPSVTERVPGSRDNTG